MIYDEAQLHHCSSKDVYFWKSRADVVDCSRPELTVNPMSSKYIFISYKIVHNVNHFALALTEVYKIKAKCIHVRDFQEIKTATFSPISSSIWISQASFIVIEFFFCFISAFND